MANAAHVALLRRIGRQRGPSVIVLKKSPLRHRWPDIWRRTFQHVTALKALWYPEWDIWRSENPNIRPDLRGAALGHADLCHADLTGADLRSAFLRSADLCNADLTGADLSWAHLSGANLTRAVLTGATICNADLTGADLRSAHLSGANLRGAGLWGRPSATRTSPGQTLAGRSSIVPSWWIRTLRALISPAVPSTAYPRGI
jgi:uncharacterized protein YjbI with pentapeptide repeats